MYLPTRTEPVKVMRSQSWSAIIASPRLRGLPVTTESISGGSPGLVEHVGERERGERGQLGRLQHHAVVGGDGGGQLVAHHVERDD